MVDGPVYGTDTVYACGCGIENDKSCDQVFNPQGYRRTNIAISEVLVMEKTDTQWRSKTLKQ